MSDYARGRDVSIEMIATDETGSEIVLPVGNPTSATFQMDVTNERDNRLGEYEADTTQVYEGESGQLTFRKDSHVLEEIKTLIRNATRLRLPTPKFQIVRTIAVPEVGTSRTIRYPNVVMSFSTNASGKNDAVEESIDWMGGFAEEIG